MSISPLLLVKQVTMSRLVVALKQSGQLPPHMVFQVPLLGCRSQIAVEGRSDTDDARVAGGRGDRRGAALIAGGRKEDDSVGDELIHDAGHALGHVASQLVV